MVMGISVGLNSCLPIFKRKHEHLMYIKVLLFFLNTGKNEEKLFLF